MMNKTIFTFLIISIACLFYSCLRDSFSEKRKAAFQIIKEASDDYKEKYGLQCCGIHEGAPKGKYDYLGLKLECGRILTREEGRKIVLECYDDFLQRFNNNENFRQYMQVYPFTEENVSVTIFIKPGNQPCVYRPNIAAFALRMNKIAFVTCPSDYLSGGKSSYDDTETLEEARNAMKQL